MNRIATLLGLPVLGLWLTGCNTTGPEAAGAAASLDPTGVSQFAVGMAPSPREEDAGSQDVNIPSIAPRLQDVAAGQTARPGLGAAFDQAVNEATRQQMLHLAMSVANVAISGAMTGGAGLVAAAPGLAMQAAAHGAATAQLMAANSRVQESVAEAERQRAAARVVPDEDRPAEARAILELVEGRGRRTASWSNPATGASGTVTLLGGQGQPVKGLECRVIAQVRRSGGQEREGGMMVCKSRGEWYDLS